MNFMKAFKKPIYRDDLMSVIRQGIFMFFITGILVGAIRLLLEETFNVNLSLIYNIVMAAFIAKRIKEAYGNEHILYSIFAGFFYILAFYLASITYYVGFFYIYEPELLSMSSLLFIMKPVFTFYFLNPFSGFFFELNVILELIFFVIGLAYAFIRSK